jgi:predicted RND superfamily exporter protein
MIASVVIGIAVDGTIHYLSRFVRERAGGCANAIRRSTMEVGPAMITSSLVLTLGFWVGCLGSFRPTIYFSLLTGATMLTALACDLFVLPAGLLLFDRRRAARGS